MDIKIVTVWNIRGSNNAPEYSQYTRIKKVPFSFSRTPPPQCKYRLPRLSGWSPKIEITISIFEDSRGVAFIGTATRLDRINKKTFLFDVISDMS